MYIVLTPAVTRLKQVLLHSLLHCGHVWKWLSASFFELRWEVSMLALYQGV